MANITISRELEHLGLLPKDAPVLFLVPVALVAWSDGHADMTEIEALASKHATLECDGDVLCISERARQFLYYNFVYQRPTEAMRKQTLALLAELLDTTAPDKAMKVRDMIAMMCIEMAHSTGKGLLGMVWKLDDDEKLTILDIAHALKIYESAEARRKLAEIGIGT